MNEVLRRLGIEEVNPGAWAGSAIDGATGEVVSSTNPATGEVLAKVSLAGTREYEVVVSRAQEAFER